MYVEDSILQIVCKLFADSRVRKVGFPDILDSGLAAGQLQSQIRGMHTCTTWIVYTWCHCSWCYIGGDDSSPYGHKIRVMTHSIAKY